MSYGLFVNLSLGLLTALSMRKPALILGGPVVALAVAFVAGLLGELAAVGPVTGRVSAVFATAQGLCWWLFLYLPLWLLLEPPWRVFRRRALSPASPRLLGLRMFSGLLLASVGAWATLVEPRRLEVSHYRVPSAEGSLRIALVADIQTDVIGDYEREVLDRVRAEKPDLVLFAGDYVQVRGNAAYVEQTARLAAAVGTLGAPLGAYAVRGDVDGEAWALGFEGTDVTVLERSQTLSLVLPDGRPLFLTGLATADSRSKRPPVPERDGLHVVVGHAPDYALARPPADLLLAGHTHGGQVQIPGFGPLVTLTAVPRDWASGLTSLPWGGHLLVSRGIGMERLEAPRVRFSCRPELVIVDVGG